MLPFKSKFAPTIPAVLLACAPAALALGAGKQSLPPSVPPGVANVPPGPIPAGDWNHTAVGDVDADLVQETFFAVDDRVCMALAPSLFVSWTSISTGSAVTDLTTLRSGDRDMVLWANASGISMVAWDSAALQFKQAITIASGAWNNAYELQTVDLDGNGEVDVLAMAPDRRTVLRLTRSGGVWSAQPSFTFSSDVIELRPVNWNSSTLQLAALTANGLAVRDQAGGIVYANAFSVPAGFLEVLPGPSGAANDSLVVAHMMPGGLLWFLTVLSETQQDLTQTITLNHPNFGATLANIRDLALGDLNQDGNPDLVLETDWQQVFLVENVPGNDPRFWIEGAKAPDGPKSVDLTSNPGFSADENRAPLAVTDMDGDGYADVAVTNQAAGVAQALVGLGTGFDNVPEFQSGDLVASANYGINPDQYGNDNLHELYLNFNSLETTLASHEFIEVAVWRADNPATNTPAYRESHRLYRYNAGTNPQVDAFSLQIDLLLGGPLTYDVKHYHHWVAYRFVDINDELNRDFTASSAWYVLGQTNAYVNTTADVATDWLESLPSATERLGLSLFVLPGSVGVRGIIGGIVHQTSMRYVPFVGVPDDGPTDGAILTTF